MTPRLFTRQSLAEYLGITPAKVSELVADGKLPPPVKVGVRQLFDRCAVDASVDAWFVESETESEWDRALHQAV